MEDLKADALNLVDLLSDKKTLAKAIKELENKITTRMLVLDVAELKVDESLTICYKHPQPRKRLDKKKLLDDLGAQDLEDYYTTDKDPDAPPSKASVTLTKNKKETR